ncbi:MAG: hypothetical protein PVI91_00890 [Gammaproteobacteria bacterium]|jgi:hypothetical protein
MKLNCYAQRLLNPFRGVMNIIEYQGAEAVTTDGVHWDIYVRDFELVEDLADSHKVQTSDIRYGSWSREQGLKRGALYPSDDFRILEHRGASVYEELLRRHTTVPFPLGDNLELWLLDTEHRPLGLLDSAVKPQDMELDCHIDWRAGQECRRQFQTPAMQALVGERGARQSGAGEYLTRHINARAGPAPQAQWFRRRGDGTGEGLQGINITPELENRSVPADAFPPFFLREDDVDRAHEQLIQDFLAWQAPWLLLLQDLPRHTRVRFERLARTRALTVDKHFALYPDIVDEDALNVARVEAALRRNQPDAEAEDDTLPTYYIELNVTRTN